MVDPGAPVAVANARRAAECAPVLIARNATLCNTCGRFGGCEAPLVYHDPVEPWYDDWQAHFTRIDLERALQSLTEPERAVAEAFLFQQLGRRKLARAVNLPPREAQRLLESALAKLQAALR